MEWIIISLLVGLVLGLSGSGGGLVAIPLFIHLAGSDIKQATVLSLVVVLLGAIINWRTQRQLTKWRISLGIFLFSILGSAVFMM